MRRIYGLLIEWIFFFFLWENIYSVSAQRCLSSQLLFGNLSIDQWEAELGQPGACMAHLRFSARSRSKCKNPIPIQAQKRFLSKGGPPEVTVARLFLQHYWWLYQKDMRGRAVCDQSSVHKLFMLWCINIFVWKSSQSSLAQSKVMFGTDARWSPSRAVRLG